MWESLATTRRQDRVLHGAAKALNVVVGLIALPALAPRRSGSAGPFAACSSAAESAPRELPAPEQGSAR